LRNVLLLLFTCGLLYAASRSPRQERGSISAIVLSFTNKGRAL
jgi:hypothetical protein